ncbi:MAG: TonB-dependent receptor plug domain-containing protein [Deltaproteobacteria bacterium]
MPLRFVLSLSVAVSLAATQVAAQPADAADAGVAPSSSPDAQAAPEPPVPTSAPPPAADRKTAGEELVVTGSRIRRKDLTTPAPVTVITRQQFEASGKVTIGDFLQSLPEQGNAPNFQLNTGGINYGADGTTRINLRSLGIARTLVLINGRRVVPGGLGASAAVDLNTIPTEAVERVEVLKDGASAVYGSDAIAGVVNIITRRNYNGTELGALYGLSGHGDAQTFDAHVTTGRSDDRSSAMFSLRYFNQKDSWLRDRDWSKQALDFDYTTGKSVQSGSSRTPQGTVRLPENPDPTKAGEPLCNGNALCNSMAAAGWTPGTNYIRDPNGPFCGTNPAGQRECFRRFTATDPYNFAAENYLTIPSTTVQAWSSGDLKFSAVRGYYEASYVQRNSTQNAAPMPLNPADYNNIVVSRDNIYNPFGVDLSFLGRRLVEFGNRTYSEELGTFRVVTGLDGVLPQEFGPLHGWYWDASMNYGRTSGTFTTGGSFRNSRVAAAVGPSMIVDGKAVCVSTPGDPNTIIPGCAPINLLGGPNNGSIDPSQIDFLGFSGTSRAFDALFSAGGTLGGELFTLASDRPASLAVGYEFRRQSGAQIADPIVASGDSADFNFKSTNGFFTVNEGYAELSLPILANMPAVKDLEASVAARYVNYSTFGGNFSYKLGARYTPIPDFTVRGTYSTAFRAPNISELYLGATETDPAATDPCVDLSLLKPAQAQKCRDTGVKGSGSQDTGLQELTHTGGNPALKAETAVAWSAGVVFQPQMIRNLSLTVDYFNVAIDNAVGTIGTANILQGCYLNLNDDYCKLVVRNAFGAIQFVNDLNQNIGRRTTAGIDFAVRYGLPTELGRFGFNFDGNVLDHYTQTLKLATGTQVIEGKGIYDLGALPEFKATAGLTWSQGRLMAGVVGRYVGGFTECANPTDSTSAQGGFCTLQDPVTGKREMNPLSRRVKAYAQFDLNAGYSLPTTFGTTTFFAGISNLFNQSPPYIYSAALANSDPSTYDYVGRFVYGRVTHKF